MWKTGVSYSVSQTVCLLCDADFGTVKPLDAAREEYETPYFPFPVYKDPVMHKMLVDIALGGAQAFKLAHRPNRMVQHVLLRIDVALTRQGSQVKGLLMSPTTVQCPDTTWQ